MLSDMPDSIKVFSQISDNSPIAKFVNEMKTKCHLSHLANRVVKWFNDTRGDGKPFDYRFTGKDSQGFLHNFMYLVAAVEPFAEKGCQQELIVHVLSYLCLVLRECVFAIQSHSNQ